MTIEINRPELPFAQFLAKPEEVGPPKSLMLMGAPGTWKTTTGAGIIKVPGFNRGLVIDIDNGSEVFANDPEIFAAVQEGRINIFPIDSLAPDAFGKLEYIINEVTANDYGYDFVMLDTGDVAQEVGIKHLMATTLTSAGKPDTLKAWGEVSKWTDKIVRQLHNAPHFTGIVIVHSKEGTEDSGQFKIKPKFAGSVKDSIAGIPSLVAHVEFKNDENKVPHLVATVGQSDVMTTKNRYNLPTEIVDFDLPMLYRLIGEKRAATHAAIESANKKSANAA